MKRLYLSCLLPLASHIAAQTTTDLQSIYTSNVHSLFTFYTSVFASSSSLAPNALPSSESNAASSFGQTTPFGSLVSTSTSGPSRSRTTGPGQTSDTGVSTSSSSANSNSAASTTTTATQSGSSAASTATSSAAVGAGGGHSHTTLAIVLGTVLGALGLGLLILLILLLCRRRRRRQRRTVAAKHGGLSSTSNEALTDRRAPLAHAAPAAAKIGSHRSNPLDRRHNAGTPLMSERIFQDVPPSNNYPQNSTGPFAPGFGDPRRSSGILSSGMRDGLGSYDRLQDGSGLNNHPYNDDHHTGSALAASVGGTALGAAAVSHSKSNERLSRSRALEGREARPEFWDEPPSGSPYRSSTEARRRRSGSIPRDSFYGLQEHANSPFRGGDAVDSTVEPGRTNSGAFMDDFGRQSHERDRHPLLSTLRGPDQPFESDTMPVSNLTNRSTYTKPSPYESLVSGPPLGAAALGYSDQDRNLDRSDTQGDSRNPLPPALTIETPDSRRNLPSQTAQRMPPPGSGTQHGSTPYQSHRGPNTGNSKYDRNYLGSPTTDDLVSPISPEDTAKGIEQGVSLSPRRANLVDVSRSRSVSPQEASGTLRPPAPVSPTSSMSRSPVGDNTTQPSGLVNAVQGHFGPILNRGRNDPVRTQTQPYDDNPYSPSLENTRASTFSNNRDNNTSAPNRPLSKPITRKPVPLSPYNNNVQSPTQLLTNLNPRRDNWWRDPDDSGWTDSYPVRRDDSGAGRGR